MFAFEELKEKFLNIPEDVQEAITSTETNEKLLALADKYKLQYDEAEELTKEIGYVMLGLKPKKDFVKNIKKATELNFEKSKIIAEEVNNTIFADIRKSLKRLHETPTKEPEEDLDEDLVREELLNELSNPKEKTTDLIKFQKKETPTKETSKNQEEIEVPTLSLNKEAPQQENETNSEEQSTTLEQQKEVKSYTIDPYREPIE